MNKTLAITAIVLVAVVMGMSTIAPAMAWEAETDDHAAKACKVLEDLEFNLVKVNSKALEKVCHR